MHICYRCSKSIEPPSPIATYDQNYYHPDCLRCNLCTQTLSGRQFIKEKNGNLTCEECNAKVAPKCSKCKNIFGPGVSYKKVTDELFFHNECFICAGPCRKPIGADFYDLENGKYLCESCYDKYDVDYEKYMDKDDTLNNRQPPPIPKNDPPQFQPQANPKNDVDKLANRFQSNVNINPNDKSNNSKSNVESLPAIQREREQKPEPPKESNVENCAKCQKQLSGTITVYNETKYHTKCFVCWQCNDEFKEKSFFKLNGNPICRSCHSKNMVDSASRCRKCAQPILDTVVTFKSGEYHDYCLVCSSCSTKLAGQSIYTDKSDNPYCVGCFTKKEGKSCALCRQIIAPNQPNLVFEDKYFHKECFKCEKCKRIIASNESFYKGDQVNGVICTNCI